MLKNKSETLTNLKYLTIGIIIGSLLSVPMAQATNVVKLIVNGEDITYKSDVPPQIINGRTLVPARALAESLGASVEWDGVNNTVVVKSDNYNKHNNGSHERKNTNELRKNINFISGYDLAPIVSKHFEKKGKVTDTQVGNISYLTYNGIRTEFEEHEYYRCTDENNRIYLYWSYDKLLYIFDENDLNVLPKYKFNQIQQ